jgi:nucleotide-binding universal stress UspA family protein
MSYSTILVHLELNHLNGAPLRIAADMAKRFDAKLIGTSAGDIQPLYFLEGAAAQKMLEQDRAKLLSDMAANERHFRDTFKGGEINIEWRSGLHWPEDFVAREARAADLVIVGSYGQGRAPRGHVNIGELVLRAGRPVLIVPSEIEWIKFNNMVIAWKDTREARRAVNDALPLLHNAKEVAVVELVEHETDRRDAKSRVDDVAAWLVRRGINAATIATKALIGVADQLAVIAQDEGADIIVAGAYGHTRLQEWAFGGMTSALITQQKRCVLLSY